MGNASGGLPYDSGDSIEYLGNEHWQLNDGSKKDDKDEKVSIFRFNKSQTNKLPIAKQCWTKLRTMKHPFILSFINGAELEDAIGSAMFIFKIYANMFLYIFNYTKVFATELMYIQKLTSKYVFIYS